MEKSQNVLVSASVVCADRVMTARYIARSREGDYHFLRHPALRYDRTCPKRAYKLAERALRKLGLTSSSGWIIPDACTHLMRSVAKLSDEEGPL
jgi:hypothetical protein